MNPENLKQAIEYIKTELTPLFEKLGQGGEWAYEVFKRQAYVNAFSGALLIFPGILLGLISFRLYKNVVNTSASPDLRFASGLGCVVSGLLAGLAIGSALHGLIQVWINPDYAAIELIIKTFKSYG